MHVAHAPVQPVLVDVGQHDRDLQPLGEQQRQLPGHQPGTHDAHHGHRPRQRPVRRPRRPLGAALHQVEGVQPAAQLLTHHQVGQRLVLGGEALVPGAGAGPGHEVQGDVRRWRGAVQLRVSHLAAAGDRRVPGRRVLPVVHPVDRNLAAHHPGGPAQRLLQEVRRLEHRVGQTGGEGVRALEQGVVVQRVLHDDRDGAPRSDQVRQQVGAPPPGDQPEEALGQAHRGGAGGDGPVPAVQGQLEAAADGQAVDEAERGHLQLAQAAEHGVPETGHREGVGAATQQADATQVGARRQDERLARQAHRRQVPPGGHLVQGAVQGAQPGRSERVRPGVVPPVVQGQQRRGARAVRQVHLADVDGGDDLVRELQRAAHAPPSPSYAGFSQITVPPMPIPTHMAVIP